MVHNCRMGNLNALANIHDEITDAPAPVKKVAERDPKQVKFEKGDHCYVGVSRTETEITMKRIREGDCRQVKPRDDGWAWVEADGGRGNAAAINFDLAGGQNRNHSYFYDLMAKGIADGMRAKPRDWATEQKARVSGSWEAVIKTHNTTSLRGAPRKREAKYLPVADLVEGAVYLCVLGTGERFRRYLGRGVWTSGHRSVKQARESTDLASYQVFGALRRASAAEPCLR